MAGAEDPGGRTVEWDGASDAGAPVPSGMYICRLTADRQVSTVRVLVVR